MGGVNVAMQPMSDAEIEALAAMPVAVEKPLLANYAQFKQARARGLNLRRFDILLHTRSCREVRMPADKLMKWLNPVRDFHLADGPPHVLPEAPPEAPPAVPVAPPEPMADEFYCRIPGCSRSFTTNTARSSHERRHRKR